MKRATSPCTCWNTLPKLAVAAVAPVARILLCTPSVAAVDGVAAIARMGEKSAWRIRIFLAMQHALHDAVLFCQ